MTALVVVSPISVDDLGAFARASTATYVGSDGLIKTAAVDAPRIDYDPVTLEFNGILLEDSSTNLLTYSEQLDNAAWTKINSTVSANSIAAPDGNLTGDKLLETVANGTHGIFSASFDSTNVDLCGSVYVQAAERSFVSVQITNFLNHSAALIFDLNALSITNITFGSADYTNVSGEIIPAGDGWYRCVIKATKGSANGVNRLGAQIALNTGTISYAGDSASGIYLWGAQLELGSSPTTYIPTVASQVTRAADVISGAGLVYSNVPETDYSAWSSATTYAAGTRVIVLSTHKIYESLQASNLNKDPTTQATWWIEVSPTNRWSCLDASVSTQTAQSTNITYIIKPDQAINALAALNLTNASSLSISIYSELGGGVVFTKTVDLSAVPVYSNWWEWLYGSKIVQTQSVNIDLPSYSDGVVAVTIDGGSSLAVGVLMLGQQRSFGLGLQYGARVGIQDYSRKEKNDFGDTVLVQRAFAKRANFDLILEKYETDQLQNFLSEIRATNVLWIGSGNYESTTIFGFYKNFDIVISYADRSDCSLEIEGLT